MIRDPHSDVYDILFICIHSKVSLSKEGLLDSSQRVIMMNK